jgi:hypothetical protein
VSHKEKRWLDILKKADELNIDVDMELEVLEYKIDKRRKDCVCLPAASPEVANLKQ